MFLSRHVPGLRKIEGHFKAFTKTGSVIDASGSVYEFPPLPECRAVFARAVLQDFNWDERNEWRQESPPDGSSDAPLDCGGDLPF